MEQSKKMTKNLLEANFRIFGIGHFDITQKEIEKLFELLLSDIDLKEYYEELYKKRMGSSS